VPCISDALAAYLALKGFNKGVVFTRTATRNVEYLIEECPSSYNLEQSTA